VTSRHGRWLRTRFAGALVTAVVMIAVAQVAVRRRPPSPAVIVLITVDTLRADFGSRAGSFRTETPFLDRLAAGGVVFGSAYAPSSWTVPSMASLFTSLPPSSHGVTGEWNEAQHSLEQKVLPASLTTLAESFQSAGYVTVGMPANLHLSHDLGFSQGFDYYAGQARFVTAPRLNNKVRLGLTGAFGDQWERIWKSRKTFLWVHYFDPHFPYSAREPWVTRYAPDFASDPSAFALPETWPEMQHRYPHPGPADAARITPLYASEVSYLDDHLRHLSDQLGLEDDDVLLIVTADHGEEFAEHGALGHGQGLHEELVRVPLLIRWPAGIAGGRRIDEPVSLLDVYPTLLDLAGLPSREGLLGKSLAGVLRGHVASRTAPVFSELLPPQGDMRAVRDGHWRLIRQNGGGLQLFDLATDPGEQHDVASERPDVVGRLDRLLTRREELQPPPPADAGTKTLYDPAVGEQMRALGYPPEP
jgi:arylsulfatase